MVNYSIQSKELFVYITALPQEEGSHLIVSCSKEDYELIKNNEELVGIFEGNEKLINEFLNLFKDKVAHNIEGQDIDFSIPYFQEWDLPLIKINYFELKVT